MAPQLIILLEDELVKIEDLLLELLLYSKQSIDLQLKFLDLLQLSLLFSVMSILLLIQHDLSLLLHSLQVLLQLGLIKLLIVGDLLQVHHLKLNIMNTVVVILHHLLPYQCLLFLSLFFLFLCPDKLLLHLVDQQPGLLVSLFKVFLSLPELVLMLHRQILPDFVPVLLSHQRVSLLIFKL